MTASYAAVLAGATPPDLFAWQGSPGRDLAAEGVAAGWRALELDTRRVDSVPGFYDEVADSWELPAWFGRNLDALFDVLGDLTRTPTVLVWDGPGRLADVDPVHAAAVLDVLRDAIGQAEAFVVIVRDDSVLSGFAGLS